MAKSFSQLIIRPTFDLENLCPKHNSEGDTVIIEDGYAVLHCRFIHVKRLAQHGGTLRPSSIRLQELQNSLPLDTILLKAEEASQIKSRMDL